MAKWTHRICERCWFDSEAGTIIDEDADSYRIAYRMPVQVKESPPGACCVCGGMTVTGIYFRYPEDQLLCQGRHDDAAAWSAVAVLVASDG